MPVRMEGAATGEEVFDRTVRYSPTPSLTIV